MNSRGFHWEQLLLSPLAVIAFNLFAIALYSALTYHKHLRLIVKSLSRNLLRTILTSMAIFVLVFVVTLVWSILWLLDLVTSEKSKDFKAIVTERWQLPSQMPYAYGSSISEGAASKPQDIKPVDAMTWQFYGGTIDPDKRTREGILFFFCMDPDKLMSVKDGKVVSMMDGLDDLSEDQRAELLGCIRAMKANKRGVIIGQDRLSIMNKRVGERMKVTSLNYKDINLEVDIIGTFPPGRYDQSAILNRDYLNDAMDEYNIIQTKSGRAKHPLSEKSLNLVWLKVPDTQAFNQVAEQITNSSLYTAPAVKVETASSGIASFLDAYRDLLWGMRWLLVPAILVTMSLVIANAISISVRERRPEMAVMKVLGYGPGTIMGLVLGEAILIGAGSGFLSAFSTWYFVNEVVGGVKFPIAFFPAFRIPDQALLWGPVLGGMTALLGSLLPAWSARTVKVSEVFSKIA
jgi:putative ABC transport system permease protein